MLLCLSYPTIHMLNIELTDSQMFFICSLDFVYYFKFIEFIEPNMLFAHSIFCPNVDLETNVASFFKVVTKFLRLLWQIQVVMFVSNAQLAVRSIVPNLLIGGIQDTSVEERCYFSVRWKLATENLQETFMWGITLSLIIQNSKVMSMVGLGLSNQPKVD